MKFNFFFIRLENRWIVSLNKWFATKTDVRYITAFSGIILCIVLPPAAAFSQPPSICLGSVNGLVITEGELLREMSRYRFKVFNSIATDTKQKDGDFWNSDVKGGKPVAVLRKLALDSLVKIKVQEKLLLERNIWPYKTYSDLINDLQRTNELRKKALASNQVVYGPVEYSEEIFFDYQFSNALILLKQQLLSEKVIVITDSELESQFKEMQKTHYAKEKYTLKAYERQVKEARFEAEYAMLVNSHYKKASRKINQSKLTAVQIY